MQIRNATTEDFNELMVFYDKMNRVINERNNDYNEENEIYPSKDMVERAIENKEQFIGIEDERIALACIINSECEEAYHRAKWKVDAKKDEFWVIHALRVDTEYEGRGFAKQFLTYLIELASKRNIKALRLDVLEGYAVEKLYTKFDFKYIDIVEILYDDIGCAKRFRLLERSI